MRALGFGSTGFATGRFRNYDKGVHMAEMELLSGSTEQVDEADRPEFWRFHVHANHGGTRMRFRDAPKFQGSTLVQRLTTYKLGDFQAVDFTSHEISYQRTKAHIDSDGDRSARLLIPRTGSIGLQQGGEAVQLRPGQMGLVDWGKPMVLAHGDQVRAWILTVPAAIIRNLRGPRPHLALESRDAVLGSVGALAEQLQLHRETMTAGQFVKISGHLVGLLSDALDAGRAPEASRLVGIARDAQSHIRAYSDDPKLTVDAVADYLGVTRRQLERAMRLVQTTPHSYLLKVRVQRAAQRLTDPRHSSRTISDIAFASGFGALSVFNKAFRDHYHRSPGDLRQHAIG